MKRITGETCNDCNAFQANLQANPKSGSPRAGWCKAASPQVCATPQGAASFWPTTDADQWCRAFERSSTFHEQSLYVRCHCGWTGDQAKLIGGNRCPSCIAIFEPMPPLTVSNLKEGLKP